METIQITSEDGEQIQFYVVEQTRVNGKDYILVTETEEVTSGKKIPQCILWADWDFVWNSLFLKG